MFIYNVTIKINASIEVEWLHWMQTEHLAEVVGTGMFHDYSFLELLEPNEEGSKTYIAQYFTSDQTLYQKYIEDFAPLLRQKGLDKFGDQFIAFRTILKKIK
ncbi:MAG: DUF4286 family protein [Bacteroidetes bacterium]|nr:DUF4286 family protein [Bacteroidota bacterium]MBP6315713.1 DUF4286 family protein [Chitinophagaceae bacterium]